MDCFKNCVKLCEADQTKEIIAMTDITHTKAESPDIHPILPFLVPLERALSPLADPLIRITTGLLLLPHGAQKLFGAFGGYGLEATGQFFASKLGLPASLALIAGLIEFFGGIALALGFLTRPSAALIAGMMDVAVFAVHLGLGFFWTEGGFEYPLFWGIVALYFVIRGGGSYSLDHLIGYEF
jgi:putative oxidoreductase